MQSSFPRGGGNLNMKITSTKFSTTSNKRPRDSDAQDILFSSKRLKRIEMVTTSKGKQSQTNKLKSKQSRSGSKVMIKTKTRTMANRDVSEKNILPSLALGLGMASNIDSTEILKIDKLVFKKYTTGTLALGYVLQVHNKYVLVSLPGGFTGTINMDEISDYFHKHHHNEKTNDTTELSSLSDIISIWQPVRCYVLGITESVSVKSKRQIINLSMRSTMVNKGLALKHLTKGFLISGCVFSMEDHGFLISTGINSITCFLPSKAVPSSMGELKLGQPIDCLIDEVNEVSRTVTLRAHRKPISSAILHSTSLPFNGLHPGMMFHVIVYKVVETGIIINFLGSFSGIIDCLSLSKPMSITEMKSKYTKGDVLIARLVYVDHATKILRFSLRPHVIALRGPKELPEIGTILENMEVKLIQRLDGLFLKPQSTLENNDNYDDDDDDDDDQNDDEKIREGKETSEKEEEEGKEKEKTKLGGDNSNELKKISRKDQQLQIKKQMEQDEAVVGVLISKKKLFDSATHEVIDQPINKIYKVGMIVEKVRVLGYHLVEGWVSGTNLPHLIADNRLLHISNIMVGQSYSATITEIKAVGLTVLIENRIQGFCPTIHLSDVGLIQSSQKLSKLYKLDQIITIRVWDVSNNSVIVTCKKTVLQEDINNLIISIDDASPGKVALGVVSKLSDEDGIRVHFCNGIKGYIPTDILTKQSVFDLASSYTVGQPIKCVILKRIESTNPKQSNPRLILALNIGDTSEMIETIQTGNTKSFHKNENENNNDDDDDEEDDDDDVEKTSILNDTSSIITNPIHSNSNYIFVSGHVTKIETESLIIRLDDGRTGFLQKYQCFEFASTADKLFRSTFSIGKRMENMLVLSSGKSYVNLSIKPLLVQVAKLSSKYSNNLSSDNKSIDNDQAQIPLSIADLSPGQMVVGYILKVESYGVLVKFRRNLTALSPRPSLADKFVSSPVGMYSVGDSVRGVIQRIESEKERVMMLLKPSMVSPSTGTIHYFLSYSKERYMIFQEFSRLSTKIQPNFQKFKLSSIAIAKVTAVKEYGILLVGDDDITIMLASSPIHSNGTMNTNTNKMSVKIGQSISVRILDIDYENNFLQVSLLEDLVDISVVTNRSTTTTSNTRIKESKTSEKKSKISDKKSIEAIHSLSLAVGTKVSGRIELVQDKYLVVSVGQDIIYVICSDYHCPYISTNEYKVHDIISIQIDVLPCMDFHPSSMDQNVNKLSHSNPYPHSNVIVGRIASASQSESQLRKAAQIQKEIENLNSPHNFSDHQNSFIDYSKLRIGSILSWEIVKITPTEVKLKPSIKNSTMNVFEEISGLLHVSCAIDQITGCDSAIDPSTSVVPTPNALLHPMHPFHDLKVGSTINCRVLKLQIQSNHHNQSNQNRNRSDSLSSTINEDMIEDGIDNKIEKESKNVKTTERESKDSVQVIVGLFKDNQIQSSYSSDNDHDTDINHHHQQQHNHNDHSWRPLVQWQGYGKIESQHIYATVITKVEKTYCIVSFSPYVSAKLYFMNISDSIDTIQQFINSCYIGQRVIVFVREVILKNHKIVVSRTEIENIISKPFDVNNTLHLAKVSVLPSTITENKNMIENKNNNLVCGEIVYGIIDLHSKTIPRPPAVMISLKDGYIGRICATELNDPTSWNEDILPSSKMTITIKSKITLLNGKVKVKDTVVGHGDIIRCVVLNPSQSKLQSKSQLKSQDNNSIIELSSRLSRIEAAEINIQNTKESKMKKTKMDKKDMLDRIIYSDPYPTEGSIVKGYVSNISSKGCFIRLSHSLTGQVLMKDLSDTFLSNPEETFPVGKLVSCRVLSIDILESKCQLSLKKSLIEGDMVVKQEISKLSIGQTVIGTVHKVTEFGVFIAISDTSLIGLSRLSDAISSSITNTLGKDLRQAYSVGDVVKAKILQVNMGTNKISLGLRPSYFKNQNITNEIDDKNTVSDKEEDDEHDDDDDEHGDDDDDDVPILEPIDESDDDINVDLNAELDEKDEEKEQEEEQEEKQEPILTKRKRMEVTNSSLSSQNQLYETKGKKAKAIIQNTIIPKSLVSIDDVIEWDDFAPAIKISHDMDEDDNDDAEIEDNEEDENNKIKGSGRRTRQKDAKRRKEEEEIREREEALSSDNFIPESKNDYERLLLAQPNSSFLWIKYMTFFLMSADYAQARSVAERALRIINFREEDEKFNVWMAWLNMEYKFGSNDTIEAVFKRAIAESKGKYIHLSLAESFEKEDNHKNCEEIFIKALKKYKYSKKVWMAYQHYKLRQGQESEAKDLLNRSMQSLAKHKHIEVITKFALAEYNNGFYERGRYLFEELVGSYPKRSDLWHVYVDREIKYGQYTYARQLFERMIASKASIRNIKAIFKKYLQFEQLHGTEDSQEAVKQKAREFIQNMMS